MMPVPEVINWLKTLEPESQVGIDDGGLTLKVVSKEGKLEDAYCEVGGIPKELEV